MQPSSFTIVWRVLSRRDGSILVLLIVFGVLFGGLSSTLKFLLLSHSFDNESERALVLYRVLPVWQRLLIADPLVFVAFPAFCRVCDMEQMIHILTLNTRYLLGDALLLSNYFWTCVCVCVCVCARVL